MQLLNPEYKYVHVEIDHNREVQIDHRGGCWGNMPYLLHERARYIDDIIFYVEFKDGEAFQDDLISTLVPKRILTRIKDRSDPARLLLNNGHEAFHTAVDEVYQHLIIGSGIPAEKIIYMTNSFDILQCIDEIAARHEQPQMRAELTVDFERGMSHDINHYGDESGPQEYPVPYTLEFKDYDRKFMNLNRRWRGFRPMFVTSLLCTGLLDKGFVSLAPSDDGHRFPDYWGDLWNMSYEIPWFRDLIGPNIDRIKQMPPLYLDTEEMMTNWAQAEKPGQMQEYYENSYFSVVSETNFFTAKQGFEPSRFFSEKTFKAIANLHPILFLSTPGMVSALKQLGYKSYAPYIDESYDQILDDGDRMLAVLKETERLSNLQGEELEDFLIGCREITEYNFEVLKNKDRFWYPLYDH